MGTLTLKNGILQNGSLDNFSPLADGVGMWFDITDFSTVKPGLDLSNNQASSILDKSGNNYTISQGVGVNQPVYSPTALNGRAGLNFVEANTTYLGRNMAGTFISDPSITGEMTIITVFNNTLNPGTRLMFDSGSANNMKGFVVGLFSTGEKATISSTTKDWTSPSNQWSQNVNTVLTIVWDGTTMDIYNNGTLKQSTASGPNAGVDARTTFNLGTGSIPGLYAEFAFQQLLVFPTALTTFQRLRNETYVNNRAGL